MTEKKSNKSLILEGVGIGTIITIWLITFLHSLTVVPIIVMLVTLSLFSVLGRYLYHWASEGKI